MAGKPLQIDSAILEKYNRPGPRYTSYPTAPHFHEQFDARAYDLEIAASNSHTTAGDVSLYFHFPFCQTLCRFCACNVIITHSESRISRYLTYMKREIDMISQRLDGNRQVVQLHWGGGTPTYLSPTQIRDMMVYIFQAFNIAPDAEISIEVDPRRLEEDHLVAVRESGFNRVSFGVQDLNPKVQEVINRIQPESQNRYVINESRRLGFDSINVDLIYGLPYQTVDSYADTLDRIIDMEPDRLAVFNYAHVPWLKKHQQLLPKEEMPSAAERLEMLQLILDKLTQAGYVAIGMDHFARQDDELSIALAEGTLYRNFQGYSTHRYAEVYAMGVTAISQLHGAYVQNVKTTPEYERCIDAGILPTACGYKLTDDDQVRRYVITELMCNGRVDILEVEAQFDVDFNTYFDSAIAMLEPFVLDGLLQIDEQEIVVAAAGMLVIRNIAMVFDTFLEEESTSGPIYSRTV